MSFDAFGARRKTNWAGELTQAETDTLLSEIGIGTSRGYTGHEHLDRTGLIHMNGRVYDPTLGRFLSADPIVQAPYFSQSYNRYTYVWNNPLGMNDPSGYEGNDSFGKEFRTKRKKPKPGVYPLHAGNGYSIVYGDGSSDDGESEWASSDQEESEEPEEGELTTELIRGDSNSSEILEEGVLGQSCSVCVDDTLGGQEGGDPDIGGYSPVSGTYEVAGGDGLAVDLSVHIIGDGYTDLRDANGNSYTFNLETGMVSPIANGAANPSLPEAFILPVLKAFQTPKYVYHFTSSAAAASIRSEGVIHASRGLYGSGVYATRWNSKIMATIQGAQSTQAVIRVSAQGFKRTPFPGTFRSPTSVKVP